MARLTLLRPAISSSGYFQRLLLERNAREDDEGEITSNEKSFDIINFFVDEHVKSIRGFLLFQ